MQEIDRVGGAILSFLFVVFICTMFATRYHNERERGWERVVYVARVFILFERV